MPRPVPRRALLAWGLLGVFLAVPLAVLQRSVQAALPRPDQSILAIGGILCLVLFFVPTVWAARRGLRDPDGIGLATLATGAVLLVSVYLAWASHYLFFPADFLIWSESDFVNDILKLRAGYPLYTAQGNNESFCYLPGAQALTYGVAWLLGLGTSVPAYRSIQLGYTLLAAVLATLCAGRLAAMAGVDRRLGGLRPWWGLLWTPVLFLAATNSLTNEFVQNLHNDALAQLVNVAAYLLLLAHAATGRARLLWPMAALPAAGFLVKQNLAIWAVLFAAHLVLRDGRRALRPALALLAASLGLVAAVAWGCMLLWGEPFAYWVFTVLGKHAVSPLRSLEHALDIWPYLAAGLMGGLVLLRRRGVPRGLVSAWLVWLALIGAQTYTSGIAWMKNHIGAGCLLAAVWLVVALVRLWPAGPVRGFLPERSARALARVAVLGLLASGLGFIRLPAPPLSGDAQRYVAEIERAVAGLPRDRVLLDTGTWIYLREAVVMRDRAPSIGERGYSGVGDFSGILARLAERRYARILVRNLHAQPFWYEDASWRQASGIRAALLANYRETGRIAGVASPAPARNRVHNEYLFSEISILEPRLPALQNVP